ncbi:MAG TPA: hypothetical protein VIU12_27610 [Chryseolinea sp.]
MINDTVLHHAKVHLVGKEISLERTVRIHRHLERDDKSLLPRIIVTANIETVSQNEDLVPTTSIDDYEGKDYIFVSSGENRFSAIRVNTGTTTGQFTEIQLLKKIGTGVPLVTQCAFELMGLQKNKQD